jgi:hypothetical protein
MARRPQSCRSPVTGVCYAALTAALLVLVAGCFSGHATYPEGWAPPAQLPDAADQPGARHSCPNLAGRYLDSGALAPNTPPDLCRGAVSDTYRYIGDWLCEASLSMNIAGLLTGGSWVELRQPDSDTLVVISSDATVYPKKLHRSKGDFDCTSDGLVRHLNASVMSFGEEAGDESGFVKGYNAFGAASRLLFASGGLQSLTRTFARAADGSLVMHVDRSTHGLIVGLPYGHDYSTWVSWAADTSQLDTGAPAATSAPSLQVANVRPFRAHPFASVWLVSIDGGADADDALMNQFLATGNAATFWDIPQVAEPGLHWLEFHRWHDPRTRYGAVVPLEAGHSYRLEETPPDCQVTAASTTTQVSSCELVLEDFSPETSKRTMRTPAMCGSGIRHCQRDGDCGTANCIRHSDSQWGFCGNLTPP